MILGCYNSGPMAETFEKRPIADQIATARGMIDKLHPGPWRRSHQRHCRQLAQDPLQPWPLAQLGRTGRRAAGRACRHARVPLPAPAGGPCLFRQCGAQPDTGLAGRRHSLRAGPGAGAGAACHRRGADCPPLPPSRRMIPGRQPAPTARASAATLHIASHIVSPAAVASAADQLCRSDRRGEP